MTTTRILEAIAGSVSGCPRRTSGCRTARPPSSSGTSSFATVWSNHHGDGRFALICAAPAGMQAALAEADPDRFYVPPYFGHRGWIGVRLDRGFDRDDVAGIIEDAFAEVAPRRLVEAARRSAD